MLIIKFLANFAGSILCKGQMDDKFIIPLNGLAAGKNEFRWQAGKEFFEAFENTEILDAELVVNAVAEKSGRYFGVDCEIDGQVKVACDRCLEDLWLPIETDIMLSVKFGDEDTSDEHQEGEIIFVPEGEAEFDMSQIIYDYVCLSLPMQKHHEEGQCNPEAVKWLAGTEPDETGTSDVNSPFAALKGLIK